MGMTQMPDDDDGGGFLVKIKCRAAQSVIKVQKEISKRQRDTQ